MFNIVLENFMSHVYTEIELDGNLTVLTGDNDTGKSAVLHAIRWLVFGEPRGDSIIRQGADFCRVTMCIGNHYIYKKRFGVAVSFGLTEPGVNSATFYKSELPEEIAAVIGMYHATFNRLTTELNFYFQHDAPFLLSESPSAGADVLGSLSGTTAVDMAEREFQSEAVKARNTRNLLLDQLEEMIEKLKCYEGLDNKIEHLHSLQYIFKDTPSILTEVEKLTAISEDYCRANETYDKVNYKLGYITERLSGVTKHLKVILGNALYLDEADKLHSRWRFLLDERVALESFMLREMSMLSLAGDIKDTVELAGELSALNKLKSALDELECSINKINALRVSYPEISAKDIDGVAMIAKGLVEVVNFKKGIDTIDIKIKDMKESIDLLKVVDYNKQINAIWEQIGDKCPMCGSIVDKKQI